MISVPTPPDPELLDRYLAGECSDIERHAIERWLRDHPDAALRAGLVSYAARYPLPGLRERKAAAYAAFLARVKSASSPEPIPLRPRRPSRAPRWSTARRQSSRGLLAAAVVLAMVGVGSWVTVHRRGAVTERSETMVAWKTFTAAHAQRTIVKLADGTRIVLAPESELLVRQPPADAPGEIVREVRLTGEGYFEVAHVADHPFVIRTPHGAITQLGTAFDVRAYRGETETQVAVTEGRVDLRPAAATVATVATVATAPEGATPRPVVLAAGDYATMANGNVSNLARGIDTRQYTAWTNGDLRYVNATLGRVIADVQRWYDVKIELQDSSIVGYRLTAVLPHGSVDDAMDVVVKSLDLRAVRSGSTVRIVGKNAQPPLRP